ncbi:hypothetical protein CW306_26630 [Bacillus sp. BA3]|uniref:hypothetical protein n=1 Tax=Bacillus sp. BA3 TaxID=2057910 RepID=UPI000C32685A|nr:hypothetical protein [Bacillus sp. BA3]PKF85647.1 hypothetical protein CW306_26630 [Bacillus sp. BA3]
MPIKSRIKKLEEKVGVLKEKTPQQLAIERYEKMQADEKEMNELYMPVISGDLEACIRHCEIESEDSLDRLYFYRDVFIKSAARELGEVPEYQEVDCLDVWYQNLKATFRYLEAKEKDPEAKPPKLPITDKNILIPDKHK